MSSNEKSASRDDPSKKIAKEKSSSANNKASNKKNVKKTSTKEGRLDHVIIRNLFINSILRRMVIIALLSSVCAFLSVFSAYQIIKVKTPPQYIQLTQDGRILPITPLNQPNVNNGEIIKFSIESIKSINTYDYINWKDQIQNNIGRFTSQGWKSYISSLVASDNLVAVEQRKLVVSARFDGEPKILKEGFIENVGYTWVVEVPATIAYYGMQTTGATTDLQRGIIRLYISRVPLDVSLRGYGISAYQFEVKS